jgi:hypothetical protein
MKAAACRRLCHQIEAQPQKRILEMFTIKPEACRYVWRQSRWQKGAACPFVA